MSEAAPERAVIDRLEDETAVLLVGDDETEHHLPVDALPDGATEGSWLRVHREDDEIVVDAVDDSDAGEQRDEIAERLASLRDQRGGGRFGAS